MVVSKSMNDLDVNILYSIVSPSLIVAQHNKSMKQTATLLLISGRYLACGGLGNGIQWVTFSPLKLPDEPNSIILISSFHHNAICPALGNRSFTLIHTQDNPTLQGTSATGAVWALRGRIIPPQGHSMSLHGQSVVMVFPHLQIYSFDILSIFPSPPASEDPELNR
jgi:hypothetical protein